jgi:hypothetical protein
MAALAFWSSFEVLYEFQILRSFLRCQGQVLDKKAPNTSAGTSFLSVPILLPGSVDQPKVTLTAEIRLLAAIGIPEDIARYLLKTIVAIAPAIATVMRTYHEHIFLLPQFLLAGSVIG